MCENTRETKTETAKFALTGLIAVRALHCTKTSERDPQAHVAAGGVVGDGLLSCGSRQGELDGRGYAADLPARAHQAVCDDLQHKILFY